MADFPMFLMTAVNEEVTILGAILFDYEFAMPIVFDVLDVPQAFYKGRHQILYNAMMELYEAGEPIVIASLAAMLRGRSQLEEVGGADYLSFLCDGGISTSEQDLIYRATILRDMASRRRIAREAAALYQSATSPDVELEELYRQAQGIASVPYVEETHLYDMTHASEKYKALIQEAKSKKMRFGWPEIDKATRGLFPGDVCLVVARSGVGKSALVQSLQLDVWKRQRMGSIFFSLEMPVEAVFERAASMESGWDQDTIEQIFRDGEGIKILSNMEDIMSGNIYICDKAGLSLPRIQRLVERKKDIGLVIIDYLGLVKGQGKDRYERVSDVAENLKALAKDTGKVVICVCQTSRKGGDGEKRLTLEMVRDSGVAEEGCDVMIGMHRIPQEEPGSSGLILAYVLKARRGRLNGQTELMFKGDTPRLVCTARERDLAGVME